MKGLDMRMVIVIVTVLRLHRGPTVADGQLLSKADDDYTPTHLWQLDSSHHGLSSNSHSLYVTLHDVTLVPGPFDSSRNAALEFQGSASSYAEISNSNGNLDATSAFSWVLLVRPSSTSVNGVILEYWDGVGGVRLMQQGDSLVAEVTDTGNNVHQVAADALTQNQWKFITLTFMGFSKRKLKLYYEDYDADRVHSKAETSIPDGTVARGTGNVRLGASFDPAMPAFQGSVSCLRYYNAYIGKFQDSDDYPLTCDPTSSLFGDSLDALSEYTMDYVESTTIVVTTPQETTVQTTQEETTVQTTQPEETTVQTTLLEETTVQTTQPEETTVQTTQQEETTVQTTQQEETTVQTTQPEETTVQTTQEETTVQTTQQEETTVQTTQPEETTVQTTQPEETTVQTTQPEETTVQTTQPEETTVQTTQPEETTVQTTQPEETTVQTTQPEETTEQITKAEETTVQTTQQPQETTVQTTEARETTAQTTESTTQTTTIQARETTASTTQDSHTTTTTTTLITPFLTNPVAVATTSTGTSASQLIIASDVCVQLRQEAGGANFSSNSTILAEFQINNLNTCAGACASTSGCGAVAVEKRIRDSYSMGRCILGGLGYATTDDANFYFYHLIDSDF